jgi:hypothetical protein
MVKAMIFAVDYRTTKVSGRKTAKPEIGIVPPVANSLVRDADLPTTEAIGKYCGVQSQLNPRKRRFS